MCEINENTDSSQTEISGRAAHSAAGVRCLVPVLARAAAVVEADGLLVEVHPSPDEALSDGAQSLTFRGFRDMMDDLQPYLAIRNAARRSAPELVAAGVVD